MYAVFNYLSFMLAPMTLWMCVLFAYQIMGIILKIQLIHLKSDFMTLKSSEGFSAVFTIVLKSEFQRVCTVWKAW